MIMNVTSAVKAAYKSPEIEMIDVAMAQILCMSGDMPQMIVDPDDGNDLFE